MISILLVDDQTLVRSAIHNLLKLCPDIAEIREAQSGQACLDTLQNWRPDIILMDIRMPEMTGITTLSLMKKAHLNSKVILLTTFDEVLPIKQGLSLGAKGCLLKSTTTQQLIEAINTVVKGEQFLEPSLNVEQQDIEHLTPREFELLLAMSRGNSNQEIADQMGISLGTTKIHASSVFDKLQVRDRTQAVLEAKKTGLI